MGEREKEMCQNCRFYDKGEETCRRYPPTMILIPYLEENWPSTWWPSVTPDHWCGEFKEKKGD